MSIAWGSLVLLLLLLPGILFFVGLYVPEQFTRETTERSPLGQLAAVLLVSFAVHGGLYTVSPLVCGARVPCVDMAAVVRTLSLEKPEGTAARAIAQDLAEDWRWIVAHVMTHVHQDDRVLMYQGFLKAFGLQRDGRFSYIVLTDAVRGYTRLTADAPTTGPRSVWRKIGETPASAGPVAGRRENASRERSYFVIEGEDVANAVFDRLSFDYDISLRDLDALIAQVQRARGEEPTPADHRRSARKRPRRGR